MGILEDVTIHDIALSAVEIARVAVSPLLVQSDHLILYLPFVNDESSL